jgi:hypothetical protein
MKPILFSTPMILALLNTKPGTWPAEPVGPSKPCKSMTRRVINPQPEYYFGEGRREMYKWKDGIFALKFYPENTTFLDHARYKVGDLLWVRETWTCMDKDDKHMKALIAYEDGYQAWVRFNDIERYKKCVKYLGEKRPSIFLQREAARLFLEVKSVRVERLQDISEMDAKAEGAAGVWRNDCFPVREAPIAAFRMIWEPLNAKRGFSWESNPFVWVYQFMRVEK